MNSAQYARFQQFQAIATPTELSESDCCEAADFDAWMGQWRLYVKNGGDTPPVKPPKP